ncbi:MAG TPA: hypothetical protein VGP57_14405, partial [Actinoplanes sp.]|nr:hypothetical protein [Actinoplanes sp.]
MVNGRYPAERAADGGDPARPVSTMDPLVVDGDPPSVHYDDEEKPARDLTGPVGTGVSIVAFAVALLVLWQVFRPLAQGSQFYLIIFLAGVLPLVFLAYRSGFGSKNASPTVLDWILAAAALLACLYPVNPFSGGYDAFLNRQGLLDTPDVVVG